MIKKYWNRHAKALSDDERREQCYEYELPLDCPGYGIFYDTHYLTYPIIERWDSLGWFDNDEMAGKQAIADGLNVVYSKEDNVYYYTGETA